MAFYPGNCSSEKKLTCVIILETLRHTETKPEAEHLINYHKKNYKIHMHVRETGCDLNRIIGITRKT